MQGGTQGGAAREMESLPVTLRVAPRPAALIRHKAPTGKHPGSLIPEKCNLKRLLGPKSQTLNPKP